MQTPFFRPEALAARTSSSSGAIVLARPIPLQLASLITLAFTLILLLYLWQGEYTRKVRVSGILAPSKGVIRVVAPQFGKVLERRIHEGDNTVAGQILYELGTERINRDADLDQRIEASLANRKQLILEERELQTQQWRQRQSALSSRQRLIDAEITRLTEELALQDTRIANAGSMRQRYVTLHQQGYVSELQLGPVENDYNDQLARRKSLERSRLAAQRERVQLAEDAGEIEGQIQLNSGQANRSVASLEQEIAEQQGRRRLQVAAPSTGIITALAVDSGQTVQAGAILASIIPADSAMEAQLSVPSQAIGFIEPGQRVQVRLTAFPFQKFGSINGIVQRVERSPIGDANESSATYRVVVKIARQSMPAYGKEQPFRAGMAVQADIRLDRRRLIEWIVDPILSIAKDHNS